MNDIRRPLVKFLPYLIAAIVGCFIFRLTYIEQLKPYIDLITNISAAFIAIPFIYLCYESVKSFSEKKLKHEIFEYVKMQVDTEVLAVLTQIEKIILPLEEANSSQASINKLLRLKMNEIKGYIENGVFLGFHLFKSWEPLERNLQELLRNSLISEKTEEKHVINIIKILKDIRNLAIILADENQLIMTAESASGYTVTHGAALNQQNSSFPDRYLLIKELSDKTFQVSDFGDITNYHLEMCLIYHKLAPDFQSEYCEAITNLLADINTWLSDTGYELILDQRRFRKQKLRTIYDKKDHSLA